jgi:uncharacterized protein (DUF849 family)
MKPLIIEVGLNEGAKKDENANVPYTPEEIAADCIACAAAGASIIHFHARDPETGDNRMGDTDLYLKAFGLVRSSGCDVQLYPTYEPRELDINTRFGHVFALVDAQHLDMGVLDMGSFNLIRFVDGHFGETVFMPLEASVYQNPFRSLQFMLQYYSDHEVIPNLAVYEPGHLRTVFAFIHAGVIRGAPLVKLFFSQHHQFGLLPDPDGLDAYVHMIETLGADEVEWMTVCTGMDQKDHCDELLAHTIERGGHVRVGVGDLPEATRGWTNAELVREIATVGEKAGRRPATPREVLLMRSGVLPDLP